MRTETSGNAQYHIDPVSLPVAQENNGYKVAIEVIMMVGIVSANLCRIGVTCSLIPNPACVGGIVLVTITALGIEHLLDYCIRKDAALRKDEETKISPSKEPPAPNLTDSVLFSIAKDVAQADLIERVDESNPMCVRIVKFIENLIHKLDDSAGFLKITESINKLLMFLQTCAFIGVDGNHEALNDNLSKINKNLKVSKSSYESIKDLFDCLKWGLLRQHLAVWKSREQDIANLGTFYTQLAANQTSLDEEEIEKIKGSLLENIFNFIFPLIKVILETIEKSVYCEKKEFSNLLQYIVKPFISEFSEFIYFYIDIKNTWSSLNKYLKHSSSLENEVNDIASNVINISNGIDNLTDDQQQIHLKLLQLRLSSSEQKKAHSKISVIEKIIKISKKTFESLQKIFVLLSSFNCIASNTKLIALFGGIVPGFCIIETVMTVMLMAFLVYRLSGKGWYIAKKISLKAAVVFDGYSRHSLAHHWETESDKDQIKKTWESTKDAQLEKMSKLERIEEFGKFHFSESEFNSQWDYFSRMCADKNDVVRDILRKNFGYEVKSEITVQELFKLIAQNPTKQENWLAA